MSIIKSVLAHFIRLALNEVDIDYDAGKIIFTHYPFPTRKTRTLDVKDIVAMVDWFPPAFLTRNGEFLFIPRTQIEKIEKFVRHHSIPKEDVPDIWSFILDPFLDTEFNDDVTEGTLNYLEEIGLSREETLSIRERVEEPMLAYTSWTWEWQMYNMYDVLIVMKNHYRFRLFSDRHKNWSTFYLEAMKIAQIPITKNLSLKQNSEKQK